VAAAAEIIRTEMRGAEVQGVAADLGTAAGIESFVAQVPAADILVNNLGIFEPKPFLEIPDADWQRFYEVNVLSGVRLTRQYLPEMCAKLGEGDFYLQRNPASKCPAKWCTTA